MSQLHIDDVVESKSGRAWRVKSGNVWYNAFKDSGIEKLKGRTIDAEITTDEKYGPGISKYKLMDSSPPVAPSAGPLTLYPTPPVSAPFWLPMASNVVAHCIEKGLIDNETQIKVWVLAVKEAVEYVAKNDASF